MEETTTQIAAETGIPQKTLSQAAQRGKLGGAVRLQGKTYWINRNHPDYQSWVAAHEVQPRVIGAKRQEHPEAVRKEGEQNDAAN